MKTSTLRKSGNGKSGKDSLRLFAGLSVDGPLEESGLVALDSNDSTRFYSLYAIAGGENYFKTFCAEYLKNRFDIYADVYQKSSIDQPVKFLRGIIQDLFSEWNRAYRDTAESDSEQVVAAILVIGGTAVAARSGQLPLFLWSGRKLRPIFEPKKKTRDIDCVAFGVTEGDRLLMCPLELVEKLSKLELKNILASENDVAMAANKLRMLADRYEDLGHPRIIVAGIEQNFLNFTGSIPKKAYIALPVILLVSLLLFMWGDIAKYIQSHKSPFFFSAGKNIIDNIGGEQEPKSREFKVSEVFSDLAVPYDATISAQNELYVVDDRETGIVCYNMSDESSGKIKVSPALVFPTSIELFHDILYVIDFSSAGNANSLYMFTRAGDFLRKIPSDRRITLRNPKAVALDSEGNIYICDRGNNRILKFDPDGALIKTIKLPEDFDSPNGIAITSGGDIFVTLKIKGGVAKITDEKSVKPFTILDGDSELSLSRPSGLAIDSKNNIYIADTGNRRVVIADPMGHLAGIIDSSVISDLVSFYPMSVKLDPDGKNLYVIGSNQYSFQPGSSDVTRGKIWRLRL